MDTQATDLLLVRCGLTQSDGLAGAAQRICDDAPWPITSKRAAWSSSGQLAYVYLRLDGQQQVPASALAMFASRWRTQCPQAEAVDVSRLQLALDLPGASSGSPARAHYTVETDPREGWADEIERWYAIEHMPGLAAVPGCVLAQRYDNHDSGPRSLACYDLVDADVLKTPAWLAVRETEWSARARPHFTNTRRTLMAVVA